MARGEVRYRLTLDSNVKKVAEESAAAMKTAGAETAAALEKAGGAAVEWDNKAQRAAMRMESMHEEALKMNSAFKPLNDETEKNALAMRAFAGALDLPIRQMPALGASLDLASVGFKNLKTSAVGFNAMTAGVVGAGLVIGTTIGSWLNTFPAVTNAVDSLTKSIFNLGAELEALADDAGDTRSLTEFQRDMAKSNEEAVNKQIERMKAAGVATEDIIKLYQGKADPAFKTTAMIIGELAEKHKKAEEATKKHAAEAKRLAEEFEKGTAAATNAFNTKLIEEAEKKLVESFKRITATVDQEGVEAVSQMLNQRITKMAGLLESGTSMGLLWERFGNQAKLFAGKAGEPAGESFAQGFGKAMESLPDVILGAIMGGGNVFAAIGAHLGGAIGENLGKKLAESIGGSLGKSLGSVLGPLGSLLGGAVGNLFGKIFGGSEEKKVNPLRDQFIAAAGGLDELNKKAAAAGLTLDDLLNADTVREYEAAILELTDAFDLQSRATRELDAAAEKYGFTTQNMSDQMAGELLKNWELLNAAGFDHNEILKRMGPDFNEYIQTAIEAGQAIPENFRPIIEEMIKMGLLTDENGKAFETLEEAGITFTESLSTGLKSLIEEVRKLVAAITGIPSSLPNYGGGGGGNAGPPGGGGGHHHEGYAEGTDGLVNFGGGTPTTLHGMEAVVTPGGFADIALMMSKYMNTGQSKDTVVVMDGAKVGKLVSRRMAMGYADTQHRLRG